MYAAECLDFGLCLQKLAPYYNLILVVIVILLFIKLFKTPNKKVFITPWNLLFFGVIIYVFEQVIAVLELGGVITVSKLLYPFLEMVIISFFIYMLLIQKNYLKSKK